MIYVSYCSGAETQCFAPHGLKQPRFARCTEQLASMMQSEPHEIPFQWVEFVNVATWKTVRRKSRFKWCHVIYTYTYYIYIMSYIYMSYICHIYVMSYLIANASIWLLKRPEASDRFSTAAARKGHRSAEPQPVESWWRTNLGWLKPCKLLG